MSARIAAARDLASPLVCLGSATARDLLLHQRVGLEVPCPTATLVLGRRKMSAGTWNCRGLGSLATIQCLTDQHKSLTMEAAERRARPPPEPPPWSASKSRVIVWFGNLGQRIYFICFIFSFSDYLFCCVPSFGFDIPVCKTLILDVGDERNTVTVFDFRFPNYGSTNYIVSQEVINSESGSRDNGCQISFCRLTHTLNYLLYQYKSNSSKKNI
ncbi:unnamed protein product [Cuscuta epithymum]|uniref:Uncharacterized protein n=1 Tax=Cuscuta epithymum TaxID=186058 RepID=A0AAV0FTU7_9ASTE|nr:unnamed protein product [Cuscuta epithymum]CAH9139032.1 unnamed protein product [Cuscuta epithymum]